MPGYPERLATEFPKDEDFISLLWSLIQIEEAAPSLLPLLENLNDIDVSKIRDLQKLT
jgi:hypothetical protein